MLDTYANMHIFRNIKLTFLLQLVALLSESHRILAKAKKTQLIQIFSICIHVDKAGHAYEPSVSVRE